MIEDKDYIIKEIKKAVQLLAKLIGLQQEQQFQQLVDFNDEQLDYQNLKNLLNNKDKLNQKEFDLFKNLLQANFIKLQAYKQLNDSKNFDEQSQIWLSLLEQCTAKSEIYDFELMDIKSKLIS